jgi:hypothetical protein
MVVAFSRGRSVVVTVLRDEYLHQPLPPREFGRCWFERGLLGRGIPHDCHAVFQGKTLAGADLCINMTSGTKAITDLGVDYGRVIRTRVLGIVSQGAA